MQKRIVAPTPIMKGPGVQGVRRKGVDPDIPRSDCGGVAVAIYMALARPTRILSQQTAATGSFRSAIGDSVFAERCPQAALGVPVEWRGWHGSGRDGQRPGR